MSTARGARPRPHPTDRMEWTRLAVAAGQPLDLLHARKLHRPFAPHLHEEFAVGATLCGVEVIRYRGVDHRSGPGSLVVLDPGEVHTGGPALCGSISYRALYPAGELLRDAVAEQPHFQQPVIRDGELAAALARVHAELSAGVDPLESECRLSWLLACLVRRHAAPSRPVPVAPGTELIACRVRTLLADRMTAPPTLTEIADDLGLSRYQVLRAFRERMGLPPYAWLAQHRVTVARQLLRAGRRPAEVSAAVGFADQAHLTRWFRRVVGVTPGVYRDSVVGVVGRGPAPGAVAVLCNTVQDGSGTGR